MHRASLAAPEGHERWAAGKAAQTDALASARGRDRRRCVSPASCRPDHRVRSPPRHTAHATAASHTPM
eukprot:3260010-Prymnesium_polylepis.1